MSAPLDVVGVPLSAGSYGPGQERAPAALRAHGLLEALGRSGRTVLDVGDVEGAGFDALDSAHPRARGLDAVVATNRRLAGAAAASFGQGHHLLVVGGNCTVALGTVAGLRAARPPGARVGVVYVDLDTDLHVPATGDGVLDWMGAAHLLALPGSEHDLAALDPRHVPLVAAADLVFVGAANVTPPEAEVVARLDLAHHPLDRCRGEPDAVVADVARWAGRLDDVVVHLDVDVLHQPEVPIAQEQRDDPGLSLAGLSNLLAALCALPTVVALTVCEVNPDRPRDPAAQLGGLVDVLARALE